MNNSQDAAALSDISQIEILHHKGKLKFYTSVLISKDFFFFLVNVKRLSIKLQMIKFLPLLLQSQALQDSVIPIITKINKK